MSERFEKFDTPSATPAEATTSNAIKYNAEPYEPPESLWQLIKSVANERELDTIKSYIGESLIENSLDLHNEIDTLLEIWRDYRYETTITLNQIDTKNSKNFSLPEPPNIRETLKKEINFFVKQMREQYKEDDQFRRQIATNNHNLNVINYVLNSALASSTESALDSISRPTTRSRSVSERPPTVFNKRTGNETPVMVTSSETSSGRQSRQRVRYRSVSRSSSLDSPRNQLKSVNSNYDDLNVPNTLSENLEQYVDEDKINCMQIDEIADHLRELLQQECDVLLKDIEFLYECIDQERDYRLSTRDSIREPSLNELKEERKRLENDLISGRNTAKISKLPSNLTNKSNRSINSPLVRASPPGSASSIKSKVSLNDISLNQDQVNKPVVKRSSSLTKKSENLATTTKTLNTLSIKRTTPNSSSNQKLVTKPINNSLKSSNLVNKTLNGKTTGKTTPTPSEFHNIKPILSRTNSASSIASSVASSISSGTSSKLSAVQKFRQMVLESRND